MLANPAAQLIGPVVILASPIIHRVCQSPTLSAALGEIKMVAVRQRGALRGVRLVVYDSVADYIRRASQTVATPATPALAESQLPITLEQP